MRIRLIEVGTVQLQLPSVEKVKTVSLPTVVEVGTQLFALAGTDIETKRLVSRIAETIVAILECAATTFVRTKSRITFTSLFSNKRERLKSKSGVMRYL
jgi:hypothetical protein